MKRVELSAPLVLEHVLSPVYWAGASLKRAQVDVLPRPMGGAFPGLLGRGLIEAGSREHTRWRTGFPFPGLLGRGLIEARGRGPPALVSGAAFPGLLGRGLIEASRGLPLATGSSTLSPVYWAGASLKPRSAGNVVPNDQLAFPGLLGRGLIEARCFRVVPLPVHVLFPRSTGPGPH